MRAALSALSSLVILTTGELLAEESLKSARAALSEHLPDIAAIRIQSFLKQNQKLSQEETSETYLLLGEAYLRAGNPDQALTALNKVPDKMSDSRNFWQGLAFSHLQNYPRALEKLNSVTEENSYFPQALFNTIEIQRHTGSTETALKSLNRLRESNPEYKRDTLFLLEAKLFLDKSELANARKSLAKLDETSRKKSETLFLAGKIELKSDAPSKALSIFETIEITPENSSFNNLVTLGKIDALLSSKQTGTALSLLLNLLENKAEPALLPLLPARFDRLLTIAPDKNTLASSLNAYVLPDTLGEDSNFANPQKLLACYYLSRSSEPEIARPLIGRALELSPEPKLASRLHLELARLALADQQLEQAHEQLAAAREAAPNSELAAQAAEIMARLAVEKADLTNALKLFAQAAEHPDPNFTEQALLNQALLELNKNPNKPLSSLSAKLSKPESQVTLQLEAALAQARKKSENTFTALNDFIAKHPTHPRLAEARLALLDTLLAAPKPDFEAITHQFASLPTTLEKTQSRKAFRLSHSLGAITNDWSQAITYGTSHRKNFPEAESNPYFLLSLAESFFHNKDYSQAQFLFQKIATLPEVGELREVALFFSARANLAIPTEGATVEGLKTLDQLIQQASRLATSSRLVKARALLEQEGEPEECLKTLDGIPGKPGDHPEAALLTAEAYRQLVSTDPSLTNRAVSIYQRLIDDRRTPLSFSNQLHYLQALTYREANKADLALEPCLKVVNGENRKAGEVDVEWDYYYRNGFEAIDILLEAKRPRAALTLARKLANTQGPGAKQALERAEQIQLDHQLFGN